MGSVNYFLVACVICMAANGTPEVFHTPFARHSDSTGRQYYAVEYLGSSQQHPPAQDYNLNHGEVDAPNEDSDSADENMENFSYNNGFVEIAHDDEIGPSMTPYDVDPAASNGELIPEYEATHNDDENDDEDDDDIQEVVKEDLDNNENENQSSLGVKVNATTEEPMAEENTENSIEDNNNSSSSTTDMSDQTTSAYVHPIYRPSSEWPLKATQLGNLKPKPNKKLQVDGQEQPQENLNRRRKPHTGYRKRIRIIRRGGNLKRKNIRIHNIRNKKRNGFSRRASSSSDSSFCGSCQCGVTTTRRFVDGKVAAVNELPWLALITYNDTIQCGGTLINDQLVLTAAHCVRGFDIKLFQLKFFEYNTNSSMDSVSVLRNISRMYSLKSYVAKTSENDVAIIRLSQPIDFGTTTVRPICLPPNAIDFTGENGIIAGWETATEGDNSSNIIQTTEVPIINNQQCLLVGMKITNDMLCTGRLLDGGIDGCQGDSGGPLMVIRNKRYVLAGIISWGDGCVRPLKPGIYTSVKKYLPWINRQSTGSCKCN